MSQLQPIYEQPADVANEDEVAEKLRVRWQLEKIKKLPKLHPLDRVILRGEREVVGFMEIKCRPGLSYGYGDGYYIAVKKVVAAYHMQATLGVDTILAVRFPDKFIWWTRLRVPYSGVWAGRKDRPDDPFAMEEHAVIPWRDFRPVLP